LFADPAPRFQSDFFKKEIMKYVRTIWLALILVMLGTVLASPVRADTGNRKTDTRLTTTILPLAFLVLYSAGALLLVNTAHNGGRLVHEFGVRAMVTSTPANADAALATGTQDKDRVE
jgi:hypothetical protein